MLSQSYGKVVVSLRLRERGVKENRKVHPGHPVQGWGSDEDGRHSNCGEKG